MASLELGEEHALTVAMAASFSAISKKRTTGGKTAANNQAAAEAETVEEEAQE